ncbi:MAG: copper homeostasis membrane protein CopD [Stellaceae bacterium]
MDEVLYACRFLQFTAAMLIFGTAAFRVYAPAGNDTRAVADLLAEFDACFGRVLLIASLVALISAIASLFYQAGAMAGSPASAVDLATVKAVLFETQFGRVWCGHLLLAAALVLATLRLRPGQPVIFILALGLLASHAWVGHAVMDHGAARIAHEANQTVHLLAAGLWLGGLVPLGWVLRQARRPLGEISMMSVALRNFSHMGYAAVALLVLTGAINTRLLVGSFGAMADTSYGRLLAFKLLLFSLMVAVALINRFRLAPRIRHDAGALRALRRSVALEQGLALAVLAIVSVLGAWPPALYGGNR